MTTFSNLNIGEKFWIEKLGPNSVRYIKVSGDSANTGPGSMEAGIPGETVIVLDGDEPEPPAPYGEAPLVETDTEVWVATLRLDHEDNVVIGVTGDAETAKALVQNTVGSDLEWDERFPSDDWMATLGEAANRVGFDRAHVKRFVITEVAAASIAPASPSRKESAESPERQGAAE